MKNRIVNIGCSLWLLLLLNACSEKLELAPVSSITDANFWKTPEQAEAFVSGIHGRLRGSALQFIYLGEMRADIFGTDPGSSSAFTGEATQGVERLWLNTLDMDAPGVSNYGGFYANINQINLLIEKMNSMSEISETDREYYLGIAHGLRAFYYFQMLRAWGDVIIQTEPTTLVDISNLAKPASSEKEVMELIKEDIGKSLDYFGDTYAFRNRKSFWSKPATLMLKAEVYLWTSYRGGGTADATVAKEALMDIQTNVPELSLLPDFAEVFAAHNKGNDEIIFAIRHQLNEATLPINGIFMPQTNLIVNYYDSLENRQFDANTDNWSGLLRAPVKIETFRKFDDSDSRKWATIQPAYNLVEGEYEIAGAFVKKYIGEQNAGARYYTNDFPVYRYADLLLLLAEAKLLLGEDPSAEINQVRERAFGAEYDAAVHGFPNQTVDADPAEAILQERFFEFILEGKRWNDLRRMGDEYVFKHTTVQPSQSYKLLWPIDRNTLTNNRALKQTEGYPQF
jgi:hypothetical protein